MEIVGVDGCKAGWVAAVLESASNSVRFEVFRSFPELASTFKSADCITVDIPIGLRDGTRECDAAARTFIGPRRSSVFAAPCRAVLTAHSYEDARNASVAATGKSISAQAFAISPKIREVDDYMTPEHQRRIREVHPEVCFTALSGSPMNFWKRDSAGFEERREVLLSALSGIQLPWRAGANRLVRGAVADDILDAVVAAWSAARVVNGSAGSLPASPSIDVKGLRMEMVY